MAQWVKEPALSLQHVESLLWRGFDLWPGLQYAVGTPKKKKKKKKAAATAKGKLRVLIFKSNCHFLSKVQSYLVTIGDFKPRNVQNEVRTSCAKRARQILKIVRLIKKMQEPTSSWLQMGNLST